MVHHLLSMLMLIAFQIAQSAAFSSPYHQPAFLSYFQPISASYHPQNFGSSHHQQHNTLGPYYAPSFGPYFPSGPPDSESISAAVDHINTVQHQRIVGGFPLPEGMIPFMAAYLIPKVSGNPSQCGGTLITPRHILTAAHCLDNKDSRPIGGPVIINSVSIVDLSETAEEREIKAFKIHELYKLLDLPNDAGQAGNGYDIAILTLDQDVTTVKPVKLANFDQTAAIVEGYKTAFATGWGRTNPLLGSSSKVLLGTVLKILSNADYQKFKDPNLPDIRSTQMSAYYPFGGRGSCLGDSGGPLMVGNTRDGFLQVGVTSYGPTVCGFIRNNPAVYTRVSRFFDWININTGGLLE